MTPSPRTGNQTAWGGRLLERDYIVLAALFGFNDWCEMKEFADDQETKAVHRWIAGR